MKTDTKVVLITDTHFGCRKGSQHFHTYFEKFYEDTFFPFLDSHNVAAVVHLGDCFDSRKTIDYWSLAWAKRVFFNPLKERGIHLHLIVGNHDIFYKNTTSINSPELNLAEYDNISFYAEPQTASINGTDVFMVPWICEGNAERFSEELDVTQAKLCMGHLELAGFYANKDYKCEHGTDPKYFSRFDKVFSGHFHKKSTKGNINYLGNPYQLYWNDEGEKRGFHTLDLNTGKIRFIQNPNTMFHKIYLEKGDFVSAPKYENAFAKIIVGEGVTPVSVSNVVDTLYDNGCYDVKVIESVNISVEEDVEVESEDTLTTLTNYVNAMEDNINKTNIINIFKTLYVESQEV